MRAAADVELYSEIEQFLYHEAWLLDQGRLDEWLALYTDDATYWIPLEANQTDPLTTSSIVNVRVLEADGRDVRVGSTLVLVEYRRERQRVWSAIVEHRLRRSVEGLRIAAKRVDLVNSEAELDGIVCIF